MEYKVIEIINKKEIIINYGYDHGARIGDDVRVYSIGKEVLDPETKISLGTLDSIKDELEVVTAYDKFSICRKIIRSNFNTIVNPLATRTRIESVEINIDESQISGRKYDKYQSPIKVGDCVKILK